MARKSLVFFALWAMFWLVAAILFYKQITETVPSLEKYAIGLALFVGFCFGVLWWGTRIQEKGANNVEN